MVANDCFLFYEYVVYMQYFNFIIVITENCVMILKTLYLLVPNVS